MQHVARRYGDHLGLLLSPRCLLDAQVPLRLFVVRVRLEDLDDVRFLGAARYDQPEVIYELRVVAEDGLVQWTLGLPRLVVEHVRSSQ
eukprot:7077123-Pyramimonas_sp.AAC.1